MVVMMVEQMVAERAVMTAASSAATKVEQRVYE